MVNVQLHENVAAALTALATLQGLTLEEYLSQLATGAFSQGAVGLSSDELDRQLDDLSLDVSPLPPDFSRADIYLDHD